MPKINSSSLVTKDFLKEEFDRFEKKIDIKLDGLKEEIDDNAKKYRDNVLTKLDEVMGELQTRREERAVETHQYSEIVEQVDDHEKRIKNLEQVQPTG